MKKLFSITCIFSLFSSCLFAQRTETISVKGSEVDGFIAKAGYKFPAYTRARVYFKNGDVSAGKFNYDYFKELMKYVDENGDTLVVANEKDVKSISIGLDTFFYDNKYYEWVASSATAKLAVRHTLKLLRKEKMGAYGTSSPAVQVESHDMILDNTNYQLKGNELFVFSKKTTYYISASDGHFAEATMKNISKLFSHKNIEGYINQNKLNLNKEEDLVDVFVYANKPGN